MDFYHPESNTCYEIKSTWTHFCDVRKIELVQKACKKLGMKFVLFVFDKKGRVIDV